MINIKIRIKKSFLVMILSEVMNMRRKKKFPTQKQSFYGIVAIAGILALGTFVTMDQVQTNQANNTVEKLELADSKNVEEDYNSPILQEAPEQEIVVDTDEITVVENEKKESSAQTTGESAIQETNTEKKEEKPVKIEEGYNGKDKLQWPISGNVVLPYSMDSTIYFKTLDQYQCNSAIMIQARNGADVKNVAKGKVVKIEKTSRYGNTIRMDIGNGFQVIYGQLEQITWKQGDCLEKGAVIGKVAPVTEFFTLEGNHLYFQIEKEKKPVNPMGFLE